MSRATTCGLIIGLCLPVLVGRADSENAAARFPAALAAVDDHARAGDLTAEKLEDEYLALLPQCASREEMGLVYAHIGLMYASLGPKGCDAAEAYCLEALRYPLPVTLAGRLHTEIANAIRDRYAGWNGLRWPVARRCIAAATLEALQAVLDTGAPAQRVPLPAVGWVTGAGPAPPEVEKRHAEEVAARQKAEALNELQRLRVDLVACLVSLYARPPFAPDELRDAATSALPKYPDVVQEIMARVKTGK